jgi:GNAT superfamily N-acetyltransferase
MSTASANQHPFADLALAQRLEKTEAMGNADFVKGRLLAFPDSGAEWKVIGGTYAMFDGPASPVTQTFGLGMYQPVTDEVLDELEQFFHSRGAEVFHEVSPLSDPSTLALLNERAYQPMEFSSVLYRAIDKDSFPATASNMRIAVRRTGPDESDLWAKIAAEGWSEYHELSDFLDEMGKISAKRDALTFLAELDGKAIATGAMTINDGVVLLAGASTIPSGRRQGAQLALLEARLRYAADAGCDIAMMAALPGSASQRNAERHGFRIAYTRTKWHLKTGSTT